MFYVGNIALKEINEELCKLSPQSIIDCPKYGQDY